jgi:hypothetical protein
MKPYPIATVLLALAPSAPAQHQPAAAADATRPAAAAPRAGYRSAFEDYVPWREQPLASWREVNDEVARAGGHLGVFRGMAHAPGAHPAPARPASEAPAAPAAEPRAERPAQPAPAAPAREPSPGGQHAH